MSQMTYACPCGNAVLGPRYGSVVDQEAATGYLFVPSHGGGANWLCPPCAAKVLEGARVIASVFGVEHLGEVYLGRFKKLL